MTIPPVAIDPAYYARLRQIESGGDPNAVNPTSGAAGLYQFIPSTAAQYGLTDPKDPTASQAAVEKLTADNARTLTSSLGRPPTASELYLAHQQGAGGASKLLADPKAKAIDVLGKAAVLNNGGTADMSAGDFTNMWANRWGVSTANPANAPTAPPNASAADLRRLAADPSILSQAPDDVAWMAKLSADPSILNPVAATPQSGLPFDGSQALTAPPPLRHLAVGPPSILDLAPPKPAALLSNRGIQVAQADTGTASDAQPSLLRQFQADTAGQPNKPAPSTTTAPSTTAAGPPPAGSNALLQQFHTDILTAPEPGTMAAQTQGPGELEAIDDPSKLPHLSETAVASLPTDPGAKARFLAKALFPKLSETDALSHIGFRDGRVVYKADDGKIYFAEPSFDPLGHPGRTYMEGGQLLASEAGPALPAIGSTIGGAATEALGGVPGAAAGGAVGEAARQALAYELTGEKMPLQQRATRIGIQAAMGGGGQLAGNLAARSAQSLLNLGRNPQKVSGYDLSNLSRAKIADIQAKTDLAAQSGVDVTPGEAGNLPSLLMRQRQLGRQQEGADKLGAFYGLRNTQQLPAAWERDVLDKISPQGSPALGARDLQQGAQDTIDAAVARRSQATGPFYRAAAGDQVPVPQMKAVVDAIDAEIAKGGSNKVLGQLQALRNDLIAQPSTPAVAPTLSQPGGPGRPFAPSTPGSPAVAEVPETRVGALDSIRKSWRERVALPAVAADATSKEAANRINPILSQLRTTMEANSPDFAAGRALHTQLSPEVTNLEQGLTGLAAGDRSAGFQEVPKIMFGSVKADPISIRSAKAGFQKAGKMDEWYSGVRSYLDNIFTDAAAQNQGPAASLWKTIKAGRQWKNLQAALEPNQLQALDNFMSIAEMVKRAPPEGSPTATDIGAERAFVGPVARTVGTVLNIKKWPDVIDNWLVDMSKGKNIGKVFDMITDPNAAKQLSRLRILPPGSKESIAAITNLITTYGGGQALVPPADPNQPLGYLLQPPSTP